MDRLEALKRLLMTKMENIYSYMLFRYATNSIIRVSQDMKTVVIKFDVFINDEDPNIKAYVCVFRLTDDKDYIPVYRLKYYSDICVTDIDLSKNGMFLVVGIPDHHHLNKSLSNKRYGIVEVYKLTHDEHPQLVKKLIASNANENMMFGQNVLVYDNMQVVVTAPMMIVDGKQNAGCGYVYTFSNTFEVTERIIGVEYPVSNSYLSITLEKTDHSDNDKRVILFSLSDRNRCSYNLIYPRENHEVR